MSNKRVFYGCLGVSKCGGSFLPGVISAQFSLEQDSSAIFGIEKKNPIINLKSLPQISFSYTEYLENFKPLQDEDGINSVVGWDLTIGPEPKDDQLLLQGTSAIRASNCLLSNISYSMSVDSFFVVTRTYAGVAKTTGSATSLASKMDGQVKTKQCFNVGGSQIPEEVSDATIQSVVVDTKINRENVLESFTMNPYASSLVFPIETTITFECITNKLDSYLANIPANCEEQYIDDLQDIKIAVDEAGSLTIKDCFLSSLRYSGGDATNQGGNQTFTAIYTSRHVDDSIDPFVIIPDTEECN